MNPIQYESSKITFGQGGGFAGIENSYVLLDNGMLFQLTEMGESYIKLDKLAKNEVAQIFHTYKLFNFGQLKVNDPGNKYYFIEFSGEEDQNNKIVWGNGNIDDNVKLLHRILMNTIK